MLLRMWNNWNSHTLMLGMQIGTFSSNFYTMPQKFHSYVYTSDSAIVPLGIYWTEMNLKIHWKTHTRISIVVLVRLAPIA